jgi:hypothetical protein
MLVYGDRQEFADPRERALELNRELDRLEAMGPGIERHARLVAALDGCGRLLQGIADAEFASSQRDRRTASDAELGASLLALARAVCRSWDSGFQQIGDLPHVALSGDWPHPIELRVPEGFAFYAVYPEAYVEAARRLKLAAPPRVIGIRSIGTSLAAVAAAALDAPQPVTVRPFGDPAARMIAVDPLLERELLDGDFHYVIVDEGPGQSGSSFGAVADWLHERGVPIDRTALLLSHSAPPGPTASPARRRWWGQVQRQAGDFAERWPDRIAGWCSSVIGDLDDVPRDISGGAWRELVYDDEREWPAVVAPWERRKYFVKAGGQRLVARFAGLGHIGEEKFAIARSLHAEGFVPEPIALLHGFLIERWCEDATPIDGDAKPLREIARYIGTRARLLPATSGSGASVDELVKMARRNVALEFGEAAAGALDRWSLRSHELDRQIVRVRSDGRLGRSEWLATKSGALIKADALDHHQAHDMIGCQDLAWDVAGAIVELDVDQKSASSFVASAEHWADRRVDSELLEFCLVAYCAFRLGQCRLGQSMTSDISEQHRLEASGDAYSRRLQHLLQRTRAATRRDSSVG